MNRFRSPLHAALAGIALFALTGCAVGPDYERPATLAPQSDKFREDAAGKPAGVLDAAWWRIFKDPELDALIAEGMKANQDIRAAVAAVRQARGASDAADAGFYPTVNANPGMQRGRNSGTMSNSVNAGGTTRSSYSLPLNFSYELDVWGRVRRLSENADEAMKASETDFAVVMQTVQTDIATNYFNLRNFDTQIGIYRKTLALFERQVSLTEKQYKAGLALQTDVLQAQTLLESTRTQLFDAERQRKNLEHALALLTGRTAAEVAVSEKALATDVPEVPAGLPSQLLERRPDVIAAEHRLASACAAVGAAKGDYFPKFMLTGSAGFQTIDTSRMVDWESRIWSLAPSVSIPIFQGGRLDAQYAQSKAVYDSALAAFRTSVLTSYRDVEDNLNDLRMRARAAESQDRTLVAARENMRLVEIQYKNGIINFLPALDAGRTLLTNELNAAQIRSQRLISTVLLVKALGGGWDPKAPLPFDPRKEDDKSPAPVVDIPVSAPGEMSVKAEK